MVEEIILTLNLRKIGLKAKRWKKASFVSHLLRKLLERKFKNKVKIDQKISEKIWEKGGKKVPAEVRIRILKTEKGYEAKLE